MSEDVIHYKYHDDVPFCELAEGFYPSKYSSKPNKLKPLPEGSTFPENFCNDCMTKLENEELI